jgi:hypothetical protein
VLTHKFCESVPQSSVNTSSQSYTQVFCLRDEAQESGRSCGRSLISLLHHIALRWSLAD